MITVMMVTYNRLELTQKTFNTTLSNAGCKYDLVVIDNNSKDDTVTWLKENLPKLNLSSYKIVELNKNMGIAYGRNMGLRTHDLYYKENKFMCTLDNDVILPNNWLKKCIDILEGMNIVGACGVNLEGTKYPKCKMKDKNGEIEEIQVKPKGNLGTACEVFKSEIHDKIGFFESYEVYGHEDAMWGYKIRMLGKQLVYLGENGEHIGVGNNDAGEYREMKNKYWDINIKLFERDVRLYANKIKPLYKSFDNYDKNIERQSV